MATKEELYERLRQGVDQANRELDQAGGERAIVLVSFALVDEAITVTLESYLADGDDKEKLLDTANGPLGLFNTRVRLCSALGLLPISCSKAALALAKIRNKYAHRTGACFDQAALGQLAHAESLLNRPSGSLLTPAERYRHVAGWLAACIALLWTDETLGQKRTIHPELF